ncbi:TBC1 domain family member 16-like protein [Cricetulus griseus]|nr:TBC1 domain family member 16-like protein [Cricetulus griseus]
MEHFIPRQETKVLDAGSSKPVTPLAQERVAHGLDEPCLGRSVEDGNVCSAMSLGRLLRRASSKASDLLTLTTGGSGGSPSILDGEIIYSKNNVCVHAPEGLQGSGEHHPVSSQDGTEDGREPRPEAVEEEGSLELSTDGVSRDSSFDSDSDAFSSPFCLSPISAALAEGNSSAFLESEGSSPSSSDANLRFPDSSGLLQTPRWDEPQRGCALEQICGVFRVDLGHMRSLRLFFSDEACTSGQLVVASRESQYKIFHFHHGGLDKLSEVFQQWKFCTETHLRDQQVTDERTCMQFSIRRPKLPSSETHPEESLYRRLDVSAWLNHLNDLGQVEEEYKLRQVQCTAGSPGQPPGSPACSYSCSLSALSPPWVLEGPPSTADLGMGLCLLHRLSMTPEEQRAFWRSVQFTVDKDVVRTDRNNQFFRGEDNPNVESMRRILLNYAVYNPDIGYSQGMSDLVAPILAEVLDESDTFWCFVGLMQNTIFVSSPRDEDMERQLLYLRELLRLTQQRFYQHLVSLGEDGLQMLFCHRWLLLCFKREFPEAEALRIWEACWAHYQTDYFHLFICVAIVAIYGDDGVNAGPSSYMLGVFCHRDVAENFVFITDFA